MPYVRLLLVCCLVGVLVRPLSADAPSSAPPKAAAAGESPDLVALRVKLRSRVGKARLEAVRLLAALPGAEPARLLLEQGLRDADEAVRRAAYDGLLKRKNDPVVCAMLVDALNQESRRTRHSAGAPLLLAILLSSDLNDVEKSTLRYVDEKLAPARDGPVFAMALADLLAARHESEDVVPLARLAASKLWEKFAVKRSLIRALSQIDSAAAIGALIERLPSCDGEVQADIIEYLAQVAHEPLAEPADWVEWWKKNQATFVFPKDFERRPRSMDTLVYGSAATYYGLPLYARRLVFVIDASGSMSGPRIEAARYELASAVKALKDQVFFTIVVYNSGILPWRRELVEANTANKLDAEQFIAAIEAQNETATYPAIETAFEFDAEAIYLLTDGMPTTGRFVALPDIVRAVTLENRGRRESIYTIGIDPEPPRGPFEVFLQVLAAQNFGLYRRVDELPHP